MEANNVKLKIKLNKEGDFAKKEENVVKKGRF